MKGKPSQGLRADAERNRRRVLEVAQEVFATEGISVRVEEIARRAGVGVGTLYRHFPTKEALFQAIISDRMERLAAQVEQLHESEDPEAAFFRAIERFVTEAAAKKDLVGALGGAVTPSADGEAIKRRLRKALDVLLSRAQAAHVIREDVDVADLFALVHGILADPEASTRARARRVAILCEGLRRR